MESSSLAIINDCDWSILSSDEIINSYIVTELKRLYVLSATAYTVYLNNNTEK